MNHSFAWVTDEDFRRFRLAAALYLAVTVPQVAGAQEISSGALSEALAEHGALLDEQMATLQPSSLAEAVAVESAYRAVRASMEAAAGALQAGRLDDALERLRQAEGLVGSALDQSGPSANSDAALLDAGLTSNDIDNVQAALGRMGDAGKLGGVQAGDATLAAGEVSASADQLAAAVSGADIGNAAEAVSEGRQRTAFEALSSSLDGRFDRNSLRDVSSFLDDFDARVGIDLQGAAREIADAISSGVGVDLEGLAESAGFDSFSDAVDAYNSAYGTNYTDQEARDALNGN